MTGWEWMGECRKESNQAVLGTVNKCSVSQRCVQQSPESVVAVVNSETLLVLNALIKAKFYLVQGKAWK